MTELSNDIALPTSSTTLNTDHNKGKGLSTSLPNRKFVTNFTNKALEEILSQKKESVNPPLIVDFVKQYEEICLMVWVLLREHLRLTDQYEEQMENWYKDAVNQQVRSLRSPIGIGLQVASVGISICTLVNAVAPVATIALGEKLKYIRLFEGIDSKEIPKSMATALDGIHKISDATIQIHGNLAGANRTSAQGEADLTKTRMEKLSRKAEENRNERNSVIQTLQQLYQQEAEARKGISR